MATWITIEGSPEDKVEAIKGSQAFVVHWGFRPPVQYNVRVRGNSISWIDTDEGRRSQKTSDRLIRQLEELGNPEVEVSYDYSVSGQRKAFRSIEEAYDG